MINLILRIIAYTMTLMVLSQLFPSFWGGFYSCILMVIINLGLKITLTKKEVE